MTQVLWLKPGVAVRVFDGEGHEFSGTIVTADRTGTIVDTQEPIDPTREPRVAVTLAAGTPEGPEVRCGGP